jgi:hypothetical protein
MKKNIFISFEKLSKNFFGKIETRIHARLIKNNESPSSLSSRLLKENCG